MNLTHTDSPQTPASQPHGSYRALALVVATSALCVVLFNIKTKPASTIVEDSSNSKITRLCVDTEPPGASLLVDGLLAGATPIRVDGLQPGVYSVRLEKEGCQPVALRVDLGRIDTMLTRKMDPLPSGSLSVTIAPEGSEVVLDDDVAGYTPLNLAHVAAGPHQLLVRKTNFDSYASPITIAAGQCGIFSGFGLHDRILEMLEGYLKREPQRVSHYIDLAHYYFVNERQDKAIELFSRALEIDAIPLNFDGPGYPGKTQVSDTQIAQDERLRKSDEQRLLKEIEKHENWPGKDCREFRQKLDQAQELTNISSTSWDWTEHRARIYIANKDFANAAQIYNKHIAALAPKSPDLPRAYAALMRVYLKQHDLNKARAAFDAYYDLYDKDSGAMRLYSETLLKSTNPDRTTNQNERNAIREMAEKSLRRTIEITDTGNAMAQCQADLAGLLADTGRFADAVPLYEKAIATATENADVPAQEDRSLRLADALRKVGRRIEARALYEKLTTSVHAPTRDAAKLALVAIVNDE